MSKELPIVGWLFLGFIFIMLISLNFSLLAAWRRKNVQQNPDWMRALTQSLNKPWQEEDKKLQELSQLANRLQQGEYIPKNEVNQDDEDEDEA